MRAELRVLAAASGPTGIAIFKILIRKYPDRHPRDILRDLANRDGRKGKWFAAAQSAGHLDVALEFAHDSFGEPATLIRVDRLSAKQALDQRQKPWAQKRECDATQRPIGDRSNARCS